MGIVRKQGSPLRPIVGVAVGGKSGEQNGKFQQEGSSQKEYHQNPEIGPGWNSTDWIYPPAVNE